MYEWLIGVEYDVYHDMVYFVPYFDYEKCMLLNYMI